MREQAMGRDSPQALYDRAPCGLFSTTMDGIIVTANQTFGGWLGLEREQVIGVALEDLMPAGDQLFYETQFILALRLNGVVREVAMSLTGANGQSIPVIVNAEVRKDGQETHIHAAVWDRTQHLDQERALSQARRAVRTAQKQLRLLENSSALFAEATTVGALAAGLATIAQGGFSAAQTAVVLMDDAHKLVVAAGAHPLETLLSEPERSPEWDALRRREVIVVSSLDDADAKYPGLAALMRAARVASLTAIPILSDDQALGALVCFSRRSTSPEAPLLTLHQALTQQVAQVMRRIAVEEDQRREREAANELWRSFRRLSSRLHGETSPRTMAELVAAGIGEALGVDAVNIAIFAASDIPHIDLRWTPHSIMEESSGGDDLHVIATGLWTQQSAFHLVDPLEPEPIDSITGTCSGARSLVVPLGEGEQVIGILAVGTPGVARAWTAIERSLVQNLATDLAHHLLQASLLVAQVKTVQRLKDLDQEKSDLIATVNHELRTPLAAITGYADLVLEQLDGDAHGRTRGMLKIVQRNAARLEALIDRMMAVASQNISGEVRIVSVDMTETLRSVALSLEPASAARGVTITLAVFQPFVIRADVRALEQVFVHVIENAVKFSQPGGEVTIAAVPIEDQDGMTDIVVTVADTGIGIAESDVSRVGARLFRGANAITAAIPGSGLGLSIVKKILSMSGGELAICSEVGVGTTVSITIPTVDRRATS